MGVGVHTDEPRERCNDPTTARPSSDGDRDRLCGRLDRARPGAGAVASQGAGHSDRDRSPAMIILDPRRRQRIKAHLLVHETAEPARVAVIARVRRAVTAVPRRCKSRARLSPALPDSHRPYAANAMNGQPSP